MSRFRLPTYGTQCPIRAHGRRRRGLRRAGLALALALSVVGMALIGCSDDDSTPIGPPPREDLRAKYGLQPLAVGGVPYPVDNPASAQRVSLGRLLFFDPILSGPQDVSCGTCHHPAFAWGDGRPRGIGVSGTGLGPDRVLGDPAHVSETPRNTPTCLNAGCSSQTIGGPPHALGLQFWDGRVGGLELQATKPIASFDEMRGFGYAESAALPSVLERLRGIAQYVTLFRGAFPDEAADMDAHPADLQHHVIRDTTYERALAAYQRELLTLGSPYDRYVAGDDWALTEPQFRGLDLFFGKARCGECHDGPMLSNYEFVRTGVAQAGPGRPPIMHGGDGLDRGRYEHTLDPADMFKFRVPSLRNVEITGPWFRTGEATSLREVVEFYNNGGNTAGLPPITMDPRVMVLNLTAEEIDQIVAFLGSLTDRTIDSPLVDPTVPLSVPSGLAPPEPLAPFSRVP